MPDSIDVFGRSHDPARAKCWARRGESPADPRLIGEMTGNIWDNVLARIETKVNRHSFYTWFKPTSFVADVDGNLRIRVPNTLFRDWLTKHYSAVIQEALVDLDRSGAAVAFVTEDGPQPPLARSPCSAALKGRRSAARPGGTTRSRGRPAGGLAPRYSFDTFIVGPSNQFAHAAAGQSPRRRRAPTTRCSSTAAWDSGRRT